jgi:hypothetical protein
VTYCKRILPVVFLIAAVSAAHAATVFMNDGKSYTGDVTVTAHEITCNSPGTRRSFGIPTVTKIELSGDEQIELAKRKQALGAFDAEPHYALGMWLKARCQHGEAQECFKKAILIDEDHAGARRELGCEKTGGKWVYSSALHQVMMVDWIGKDSVPFHLKMAHEMHRLGLADAEERELRRVLQCDQVNLEAIRMLQPLIAGYRTKNAYRLPFDGTWGTTSGPMGYGHGDYAYMMNAWDFRKVDAQGHIRSGPPEKLESYFTYNAPVYAAADGEVYNVRDGCDDNPIGATAGLWDANRVLIRHSGDERSVIGHMKKGTIVVKVGDKVKQGQFLGLMGNSGRSTMPHIHFAVYDADGISLPVTFYDYHERTADGRKHVQSGQLKPGRIYENVIKKDE